MSHSPPAPTAVPAPSLPSGGSPAMAAVAAHQVRGPLSSVRLRLELLQDRLSGAADAAARREVSGVLREVDRLAQVLDQVLAWGTVDHGGDVPVEPVDLLSVAASRVDAWSALAAERGVRLRIDGTTVAGAHVRGSLEQVLDVLLDNALEVTPVGGSLLVAVRTATAEARVEVIDQGPGMTDEEIAHACEPFWRGTCGRGRKGTGLGLTIAAALLAASGGRLELSRSTRGGLRAVAVLPRAA